MHEINIADRVFREAKKAGASKFLKVEVGELCEITVDELREGLEKVTKVSVVEGLQDFGGTVLQNSNEFVLDEGDWKFEVEFVKSEILCVCGYAGEANILDRGHGYCIYGCPQCGETGGNVEVLKGGEIRVVEVD